MIMRSINRLLDFCYHKVVPPITLLSVVIVLSTLAFMVVEIVRSWSDL